MSEIFILSLISLCFAQHLTLELSPYPKLFSENDDNKAYYAKISIGTPGQIFPVFISTWTTTTAVPKKGGNCDSKHYFLPSSSSTFQSLNIPGSVDFQGDNDLDGTYCRDTILMGDENPIQVSNFNFLLASYCNCSDYQSVGVLGLGFSDSEISNSTLVKYLKSNGLIKKAIFSLYLSNTGFDDDKSPEARSSLMLGGYDKDKYADDSDDSIHYHDVQDDSQHWYLELSEVRFSSVTFLDNTDAIVDPGSKYLYGPDQYVDRIRQFIRLRHLCYTDDGKFKCHCNDYENFRDITFVFDGIDYDIGAKWFVDKDNGICTIHIYGTNHERWILGQIFLRKYYSVWDYEKERIGFIKSINVSDSSSSSAEAWVVIVVVVCTLCVLIGSFVVLIVIYKKKKTYRNSVKSGQYSAIRIN